MPREHAAYWQLVEQLMHFGWYRVGSDRNRDPSGRTWRFREGHTVDGRPTCELWITAADEAAAMRILVDELHYNDAD
jgi:hypothetical protein